MRPFLRPDPVIVEAGAHIGLDTTELAHVWPKGVVHAFEPIPHLFRQLEARTAKLPNVTRYRLALGGETGTASMWVSEGGDGSSSLFDPKTHLDVFPDIHFRTQIDVPTVTLDDWAQREGVERIDFLWLDMQGAELAMLQHAPRLLPSVRAIILEVFLEELYEGAPLWSEARAWLADRGFHVVQEKMGESFGDVLVARTPQPE